MSFNPFRSLVAAALAVALLLPAAVSCQKQEAEDVAAPMLTVLTNPVGMASDSQFLRIEAEGDWEISLDLQGATSQWISVKPTKGSGSKGNVLLSWEAWDGDDPRGALITVTGKGGKSDMYISQKGKKIPHSGAPSTNLGWLELPSTDPDDDLDFFSHDMVYNRKTVRNYSFYWDYDALVAPWVAYPMVPGYVGGSGRTETWDLDPLLTRDQQPVMYRGLGGGYDRGHQLPSQDRTFSEAANNTTFYFTNMTPQIGKSFNQGIWVGAETLIRTWANKSDTLYVVTGCVTKGSTTTHHDNDSKIITVPVAYYKAALSLANGSYKACGLYLEHTGYPTSGNKLKNYCLSIDKLEEKLGYDLFVNLPKVVGESQAAAIESTDPATVSWWW